MSISPRITRPTARVAALLAGLFLVTAVLSAAAPIQGARADDSSGISGAPADEKGTADDRTRFSYQIAAGQHLTDYYLVRNTGATPENLTVFATDAYNTKDGSYGLLDSDTKPTATGLWVTFAGGATKLEIPLAPGASQLVPFSLDVPANALPGDHAGGIVISNASPQGQILVDRRVATRLYVRIPGALTPAMTVSSIAATYTGKVNPFDGTVKVYVTLKNNGNISLGANMVVGARTWFGIQSAAVVHKQVEELLPGNTRVMTITLPSIGQLGYLNPYVELAPTVDADALNPGPLHLVTRDTTLFVTPWWFVVLLAIAIAVVLFIVIRRRRDAKNAAEWIEYTEAEARRVATEEAAAEAEPAAPVRS